MKSLRRAVRPLVGADTYRRWAFLVLGGVVFVPFALAMLVVLSLVVEDGAPNPEAAMGVPGAFALVIAVGLGATTAALPGVRHQQVGFARWLLGGPLAREPAGAVRPERSRAAAWMAIHLAVGFAICIATMLLLSEAATLALVVVTASTEAMLAPNVWLLQQVAGTPAHRVAGPVLGAGVLAVLVLSVAGVGRGMAWLAGRMLGPTPRDRILAAQAQVDGLANRNRLAAELHDSIGHALSIVALQAAAASRLVEDDPASARAAADEIARQARSAVAELDHVLGLLREDPGATAPQRDLSDLPALVEASRSAGVAIELRREGEVGDVPPVVSREAYRLCQEGVTNALRHGVDGAPVLLQVEVEEDRLRVQIANEVAGRGRPSGGGRGLANLRDRTELLGGELTVLADAASWRLVASIPLAGRR